MMVAGQDSREKRFMRVSKHGGILRWRHWIWFQPYERVGQIWCWEMLVLTLLLSVGTVQARADAPLHALPHARVSLARVSVLKGKKQLGTFPWQTSGGLATSLSLHRGHDTW